MDGRIVQVRPGQGDWEFRRDLAEGHAAIEMVALGHARTVALHNFRYAAQIAPKLIPVAQRQRIGIRIERHPEGVTSLMVGPRSRSE